MKIFPNYLAFPTNNSKVLMVEKISKDGVVFIDFTI